MRKALALVSVAVTVGLLALGAACTDDGSGSAFDDHKDGGDPFDTGPGFTLDGSSGGNGEGGPAKCDPHLPTNFAPVWNAPTKKSVCTADELTGYYDACAANLKDAKCLTWTSAHKSCAACIEPDDGSGPIQPHRERLFQTLNVAGCISLELTGGEACAKAYDASFQCKRLSCEDCFNQPNADFNTFKACQANTSSSCADWNTKAQNACLGVKDAGSGAPTCFPTASEDNDIATGTSDKVAAATKSYFVRVEGIFCGPP
jgi:hypothetical protein